MEAVCYSAIAGWDTSKGFFWYYGLDKYPPKVYALMAWSPEWPHRKQRRGLVGDPYVIGASLKGDYRIRLIHLVFPFWLGM